MNRNCTYLDLKNGLAVTFIILFSSCASTKKVSYFQDITAVNQSQIINMAQFTEPVIKSDDILAINIFSIDPASTVVSNQASSAQALGTNSASSTPQQTVGFLVDKEGEVELVGIGKLKLAGLTTYQAKALIRLEAEKLYNKPSVEVRFANFKVTVLGEVNRPAVYTMPNEKVTFLDALGLAGDMTIFGKRENVMLIRDNAGKKEFIRFDLNSTEFLNSPFFYLKQNDVIYVEPNKGKAASLNAARTQTYAIIGSALSVLVVLFSRL
ncbi:MAG: polysaccharide biosynthesis/export family protein [Bacteroidota bacterium]